MHIPPTRSVTLVLRSMDGVAYTTGLPLDSLHKEIHLSLTYASRFIDTPHRFREELIGVVTHEMVHAYQWDAEGTCPGGLIEGIADYVRLKAGLAPPHWKKNEKMDRWDEGYQRTAYFLEFLEGEYGTGTVAKINAKLRQGKYEAESFWTGIFGEGRDVDWLFKKYRDSLKGKEEVAEDRQALDDDGVLVELEEAGTLIAGSKVAIADDGAASR